MTVKELIKKLERLDQNLEVCGRGYESGYNSITKVSVQWLIKDYYKDAESWYEGRHQHLDDCYGEDGDMEVTQMLTIT